MADPVPSQAAPDTSTTSTITLSQTDTQDAPTVTLRLKKPKNDRKVQWTSETVDNEEMNKKKSKCCCIFKKPKKFDESSSDEEDSDDECEHCQGHVEKKKETSQLDPVVVSNPSSEETESPS